ncbi:uncharacterized protein LOC127260591 [Andrographis paniculata]|uniref:uncharacterized protein LOC127260591 n=1 Tax=Andrographis paniculata TaxID=175694 RepID=UPI0021E94E3F|nr:uncharacterized protein LOC127260591 [Andrographis paniculata]
MRSMMVQSKQWLPLSQAQAETEEAGRPGLIRRRLSSLSLKIQPSSASEWGTFQFRHSKSFSSAGNSIRKWWGWGWDWILSRKPTFAADLEMNEEETAAIGGHNRGSWRHVFFKLTSQLRRKLKNSDNVGLPQTCRYDSVSYAKNFDDGRPAAASFVY